MPRLDADLDLYDRIKLGLVRVKQNSRPEYRFWKRVNKDGPIHPIYGQCWVWTGGTDRSGYGKFKVGYQSIRAHRWAYEEFVGRIPDGLCVLHRCDNSACIRPEHLFLGNNLENIQDKVDKDRQAKGEVFRSSKLTDDDVREIRRRYRRYSRVCNSFTLAREFGVDPVTIQYITTGKGWNHVS
jgi:hypothetical protein